MRVNDKEERVGPGGGWQAEEARHDEGEPEERVGGPFQAVQSKMHLSERRLTVYLVE